MAVEKPLAPTAHLELVAYLVTLIGELCRHAHISAHGQDRALGCVAERAAPQAASHEPQRTQAGFAISLNTRYGPRCCRCRNYRQSHVVSASVSMKEML